MCRSICLALVSLLFAYIPSLAMQTLWNAVIKIHVLRGASPSDVIDFGLILLSSSWPPTTPSFTSPKTLRQTIRNHQLLTGPEAPPQIPHPFIQARRKHLIHIAKHRLMVLQLQSLAQELDNGVKVQRRRHFVFLDVAGKRRCAGARAKVEKYCHC